MMTVARKTIAIDIDDVLADSTEALRLLVNERTGASLTPEHYRVEAEYWGYYEHVWSNHGLVDEVTHSDLSEEMVTDQSHVGLVPGARSAIDGLADRFNIILITARDKSWQSATERWLKANFEQDDTELYFCESHKDANAKTKGQLCKELGVSILIDDNVGHCQSALDEEVEAILFGEYGWHIGVPSKLVKCKDWPSVVGYLDGIK